MGKSLRLFTGNDEVSKSHDEVSKSHEDNDEEILINGNSYLQCN